tara:strand:- start:524 stop:880 length:357 start_codon:yes stop_codon:yes gene_type:complete
MPKHYKEMIDEIINKMDEEVPANSVSSGGVDMAPNAGGPRKMIRRKKENEKAQDKVTKKISKMVKQSEENNSVMMKGILNNIDKIEEKVDEVSGIDNTIQFKEEKPYQSFSDKFKVGK